MTNRSEKYTISIYTAAGIKTVKNCYVMVLGPDNPFNWPAGLYYTTDRDLSTYEYLSDLVCLTLHDTYVWYHGSQDITMDVYDWLEHNQYEWPLNKAQLAHFTLRFL